MANSAAQQCTTAPDHWHQCADVASHLPVDGRPMLEAVPAAELTMMAGVGHVPMIDDPAAVARAILDFVEESA